MLIENKGRFDYVVVGAGIFGSYAALRMSQAGMRVLLLDHESRPWRKASAVNQARMHFGYHYPRSIATARLTNGYRDRFEIEHKRFINSQFTKYYGIDKSGSLTSAAQFERFCEFISIRCRKTTRADLFRNNCFEALYETTEYSFDPFLLRDYYRTALNESDVVQAFGWSLVSAEAGPDNWEIEIDHPVDGRVTIDTHSVLNAAYANINSVNEIFGLTDIGIEYELAEVVILTSPQLRGVGLTVMDGPYFSVMPYGQSQFHSLTSVLYTHHGLNRSPHPTFGCQSYVEACSPERLSVCTSCMAKPHSNSPKMLSQMSRYISNNVEKYIHGSLFTIKAKLIGSEIDDARPTDIRTLSDRPRFSYVFSGKINSIYEVEKLINET